MLKIIYLIRNKTKVGSCKLEIDKINNTCFLENVKIYKQYRGKGYGIYLVQKAVNLAKK